MIPILLFLNHYTALVGAQRALSNPAYFKFCNSTKKLAKVESRLDKKLIVIDKYQDLIQRCFPHSYAAVGIPMSNNDCGLTVVEENKMLSDLSFDGIVSVVLCRSGLNYGSRYKGGYIGGSDPKGPTKIFYDAYSLTMERLQDTTKRNPNATCNILLVDAAKAKLEHNVRYELLKNGYTCSLSDSIVLWWQRMREVLPEFVHQQNGEATYTFNKLDKRYFPSFFAYIFTFSLPLVILNWVLCIRTLRKHKFFTVVHGLDILLNVVVVLIFIAVEHDNLEEKVLRWPYAVASWFTNSCVRMDAITHKAYYESLIVFRLACYNVSACSTVFLVYHCSTKLNWKPIGWLRRSVTYVVFVAVAVAVGAFSVVTFGLTKLEGGALVFGMMTFFENAWYAHIAAATLFSVLVVLLCVAFALLVYKANRGKLTRRPHVLLTMVMAVMKLLWLMNTVGFNIVIAEKFRHFIELKRMGPHYATVLTDSKLELVVGMFLSNNFVWFAYWVARAMPAKKLARGVENGALSAFSRTRVRALSIIADAEKPADS